MKVIRVKIRSLHNEEWFELFTNYKDEAERFGPTAIGTMELHMRILPLYDKADKLLLVLRKSVYTKEIEAADKKCVDICQAFFNTVKSARKLPNALKQKAADHLYNLLEGYKDSVLSGTYAQKSAAVYNLLADLRGTVYAPDVTALTLAEWVTAIDQAEQAVLTLSATRMEESVAKPKEDLQQIRRLFETYYTAAVNVWDTRLMLDGLGGDIVVEQESLDTADHDNGELFNPEVHGNITYNFVIAWNERLKKFRNLLQQRAGRRDKAPENEEDIL
ncbi:MAG: DUF6261 family protein [Tannerellaceae bacterium]|jgi:hypothetical protein|nr:DUF6261 family protein [Tannerellaceae bacterium]